MPRMYLVHPASIPDRFAPVAHCAPASVIISSVAGRRGRKVSDSRDLSHFGRSFPYLQRRPQCPAGTESMYYPTRQFVELLDDFANSPIHALHHRGIQFHATASHALSFTASQSPACDDKSHCGLISANCFLFGCLANPASPTNPATTKSAQ